MIIQFEDKQTQALFAGESIRKFSTEIQEAALRKMQMLHAATSINSLQMIPGLHCKKMTGKLRMFWSIRVNNQYRIIFTWTEPPPEASRVWLTDPH
jgi:toxin HigB-1